MKYKIGVFGSGGGSISNETLDALATQLGQALGKHSSEVVVVTGGCTGLPYLVAKEASKMSTEVWGYSPVVDIKQQRAFTPNDDLNVYTKLHFVDADLAFAHNLRVCMKYRNVLSTSNCDAGIVISGRWGSLNEFTNLVDMQKLVGVLTNTGGIADELPKLNKKIHKEGQGQIIFASDPKELIEEILRTLKTVKKS